MPSDRFTVARNPDEESSLPYLLWIPTEGGIVLKAREPWPHSSRVYCHPVEEWPAEAEVLEEVPVRHCRRRGSAIDLVLDRARNNRAQFVFTEVRRRPAIFWQTAKVVKKARPGVRVPARKASGLDHFVIAVDTRERYPYKFARRPVETERTALEVGDYAVRADGETTAAVERKRLDDLARSLSDGSLAFVMAELAALPAAAVVVEDRYSALFKIPHVQPGWLPELVAASRSATRRSRSSSARRGSWPRSGPTGSWRPPFASSAANLIPSSTRRRPDGPLPPWAESPPPLDGPLDPGLDPLLDGGEPGLLVLGRLGGVPLGFPLPEAGGAEGSPVLERDGVGRTAGAEHAWKPIRLPPAESARRPDR